MLVNGGFECAAGFELPSDGILSVIDTNHMLPIRFHRFPMGVTETGTTPSVVP